MSRISHFFKISIIACTVAACAQPIGNIGGSGSAKSQDALWAVPYRVEYNINDLFLRQEDLSVLASYKGMVQYVPVDKVELNIIKDPDWTNELSPIPEDSPYRLEEKGRKVIVVTYGDLSARYSITVKDPFDLGGGGGGNGSGEGSGIIIEWVSW